MKLTRKQIPGYLSIVFLGALVGTLAWEILERILAGAGIKLGLSIGPIGFDVHVIAVSVRANPGTLVGIAGGALLFFIL